MKRIIFLLIVLSLLSCSAEKTAPPVAKQGSESGNGVSAPAASAATGAAALDIVPHEADRHSELLLVSKGVIIGAAKIEWLVNGTPSGSTGDTFDAINEKTGDTVQARVTLGGKEMLSNVVEIQDTPPEFTRLKIMPEVFKPGDRLSVEAEAKDIDDDPVTIAYEWTKNGEPAGNGYSIDAPVKRGDKVAVKVTPYDGLRYGKPVVLEREIGNMPPEIDPANQSSFMAGVFKCQPHATDPDGDVLTWSLKTAPRGMTINPSTGLVTWPVPADFTGKTSFMVCVSDGRGGQATQTFYFTTQ